MSEFRNVAFVLLTLSTRYGFAHGENKLGPHGGYIRMPGAFHTEIVPAGDNKFKVYLLDIEWGKPSVTNSTLEIFLNDNQKTKAQCEIENELYVCSFPKSINLNKKAELKVLAQRENQKGNEVIYELPLKLKETANPHTNHR